MKDGLRRKDADRHWSGGRTPLWDGRHEIADGRKLVTAPNVQAAGHGHWERAAGGTWLLLRIY